MNGKNKYNEENVNVRTALPQNNPLYLLALYRLYKNRDLKILITGSGGTTGVGKSLYALIIGRELQDFVNANFEPRKEDPVEFNEDSLYVDVWNYINDYPEQKAGSVVLHDEIEVAFDNRRSMAGRQVEASQRYYTMRAHQLITIATAPSRTNLDIRIAQNFDIWIQVLNQGEAVIWHTSENDFNGSEVRRPMKYNNDAIKFKWTMPKSGGEVMALKDKLDEMKDSVHDDDVNKNSQEDESDEEDGKKALKDEIIELRKQRILDKYPHEIDTQKKMARDLDVSQSTVSDYVDDLKHEGRL